MSSRFAPRSATSCSYPRTTISASYATRASSPSALRSDVVHRRARGLVLALDDVGDCRLGQDGAGCAGGLGEDALGVRAEAAVEEFDDLEDGDLARLAGEGVAALHAALGAQDARSAQDGEELLEELDRDVSAAGELADRHWAGAATAGELGERSDRVRRLGGDREHGVILTCAAVRRSRFRAKR